MRIECCPFCGSHKVNVCRTNADACWIECANDRCGAVTRSRKTKAAAVRVWNKRVTRYVSAEVVEDDDAEFRARLKRIA